MPWSLADSAGASSDNFKTETKSILKYILSDPRLETALELVPDSNDSAMSALSVQLKWRLVKGKVRVPRNGAGDGGAHASLIVGGAMEWLVSRAPGTSSRHFWRHSFAAIASRSRSAKRSCRV